MWKDPIVEEVRNAGAKLAEEANNDLHQLCKNLQKKQEEHPDRLIRRKLRPLLKPTETNDR